jgi:hypothetical protein
MLSGGEERNIGELWSSDKIGEAIIGKVISFRTTKTKHSKHDLDVVTIAELAPVVVRSADGTLEAFGGMGVILSAALRLRINAGLDVGHVFAIAYEGTTKTASGTMKTYSVVEHNDAKLRKMLEKAGVEDELPF